MSRRTRTLFDGDPVGDYRAWQVQPIGKRRAAEIVRERHYLHRRPPMSYAIAALAGQREAAIVTFGVPASRNVQRSVCPSNPDLVLELNRLWIDDDADTGAASWFLSRALRQLPPLIIVSYADTAYGHRGVVYHAANFHFAGMTDADRKTPRLDYIASGGRHSREASRSGAIRTERRSPKARFWVTTGGPLERRRLRKLVAWDG